MNKIIVFNNLWHTLIWLSCFILGWMIFQFLGLWLLRLAWKIICGLHHNQGNYDIYYVPLYLFLIIFQSHIYFSPHNNTSASLLIQNHYIFIPNHITNSLDYIKNLWLGVIEKNKVNSSYMFQFNFYNFFSLW